MKKSSRKRPAVSVIIPAYNVEKYIRRCLDSILRQTFEDFEVVVVDDGSTDGTREIVDDICERDERVRAYHIANRGVSEARNFGMEKAKGNYIMFVDGDDTIEYDMLRLMMNALIDEDVDVVKCRVRREKRGGAWEIQEMYGLEGRYGKEEIRGVLEHFITIEENISAYSYALLMKKSVVPRFDEKLAFMEDTVFFVDLLKRVESICIIRNILYNYHYNQVSETKSSLKAMECVESGIRAGEMIWERISDDYGRDSRMFGRVQTYRYCVVVSRIKIFARDNSLLKVRRFAKDVMTRNDVRMISNHVLPDSLTKMKKIQYFASSRGKWMLFALLCKVSNLR